MSARAESFQGSVLAPVMDCQTGYDAITVMHETRQWGLEDRTATGGSTTAGPDSSVDEHMARWRPMRPVDTRIWNRHAKVWRVSAVSPALLLVTHLWRGSLVKYAYFHRSDALNVEAGAHELGPELLALACR
jgi:hypothetical protein